MSTIKELQCGIRDQKNKLNHLKHPRKIQNFRQQLLVKWIASITEEERAAFETAGVIASLRRQIANPGIYGPFKLGTSSRFEHSDAIDMTGLQNCSIDSDLDFVLYGNFNMTFEGVTYSLSATVYKHIDEVDEQLLRGMGVIKTRHNSSSFNEVSCEI